jgi:dTDP-glucose pyrophosphorylase
MRNIEELFVLPTATLRDVLVRSNATRRGIVLAVDSQRRLTGVITDGDIRREMLAGTDHDVSVRQLLTNKGNPRPITASLDASHAELVEILRRTAVSHIPLVNADGVVERLVAVEDLLIEDELALQAVVMAGGRGTRLHPLTEELPKPMLPVGDKPLMERIICQLAETGIRQVNITTHYLAHRITEYFGDGSDFGVNLTYVPEVELLGTAGGLALMPMPETPLLVINGDILTDVDFRAMLAYHRSHGSALTVAVRSYEVQVPYGVVESDGVHVRRVVEKPTYRYFVNAGIYLIEPGIHQLVPKNRRFDMTDLIEAALERGLPVVTFPIWEYWRDIGQHTDYAQAQTDVKDGTIP